MERMYQNNKQHLPRHFNTWNFPFLDLFYKYQLNYLLVWTRDRAGKQIKQTWSLPSEVFSYAWKEDEGQVRGSVGCG